MIEPRIVDFRPVGEYRLRFQGLAQPVDEGLFHLQLEDGTEGECWMAIDPTDPRRPLATIEPQQ